MQAHISSNYHLLHSLEVPELAPLPAIRSARAATVAQWFGMTDQLTDKARRADQKRQTDRALLRSLLPRTNQITFLTGPSGAGKSSMLRALRMLRPRARWMDLQAIELPDTPLVDCFEGTELDRTLALLSQVGLAEAWSYLRTPAELSEGQRWRLKLALAMRGKDSVDVKNCIDVQNSTGVRASARMERSIDISDPCGLKPARRSDARPRRLILLADEFAALLDRVTAAVVARCLRRVITTTPDLCAIVATSHEDLTRALAPDTIVNCDFRLIEVLKRDSPDREQAPRRSPKRKPLGVRPARGNFSRGDAARR